MNEKLDWLSPRRPDNTDIAEYTVRVGEALKGRYPLNEIGNETAEDLSRYQFAYDPFFNLGNDVRFHGKILSACQKISGVVIAHDFRIQHLLVAQLEATETNWQAVYEQQMLRHYGEAGREAALGFLGGHHTLEDVATEYPGIELAADCALALITHNERLADELARRTGLYCATLPLPFPVPATLPDRKAMVGPLKHILIFGYLGRNRGLDVVLDLVAQRRDIHLHVAGQIGPENLQRRLRDLSGDGCSITDHGFLTETELDDLIRNCDLVVNLRNPSMGEVSGSQLRIFANGGLSALCDTEWYSSLPETAAFKVSPANMAQELNLILDSLSQDGDRYQTMRQAGHDYVVRIHSLDRFADHFDRFMREAPTALAHGRRLQLAKQMGRRYQEAGAAALMGSDRLLDKAARLLGEA